MSAAEVPPSSRAAEQAWFSMLLVNDPNTALVGALRPTRAHPLWTAIRRPFERAPVAREAVESIPGLRPRPSRWLGVGLLVVFGVGLSAVGLGRVRATPAAGPVVAAAFAAIGVASAASERLGTTTLQMLPAPAPVLAASSARTGSHDGSARAPSAVAQRDEEAEGADVAATAREPRREASQAAVAEPPRAAKAVSSKASVKKAAPRRLRGALGRLSGRRAARR